MVCAWRPTPRWLFWLPTMRRLRPPLCPCGGCPTGRWEYQSPEFVARELLEVTFGPDTTTNQNPA